MTAVYLEPSINALTGHITKPYIYFEWNQINQPRIFHTYLRAMADMKVLLSSKLVIEYTPITTVIISKYTGTMLEKG